MRPLRAHDLMLLPWTLLGVLAVTPASAQPRVNVAVDLSALDAQTFQDIDALGLEKRMIVRLVQDGFAVVARSAAPDVTLTISRMRNGLEIAASGPGGIAIREVATGQVSLAELHLEICQKIVELARAAAPIAAQRDTARPSAAGPPAIAIGADAGMDALLRPPRSDLQVRAALRLALANAWAVAISTAMAPANQAGIRVTEWSFQGGAGYRVRLASQLDGELWLLAGPLLHHYSLKDASAANPSGTRWALAVSVPLMLVWRPLGALALAVRVAPRLTFPTYAHVRHDRTIWARDAASIEVGAGFGWRF